MRNTSEQVRVFSPVQWRSSRDAAVLTILLVRTNPLIDGTHGPELCALSKGPADVHFLSLVNDSVGQQPFTVQATKTSDPSSSARPAVDAFDLRYIDVPISAEVVFEPLKSSEIVALYSLDP